MTHSCVENYLHVIFATKDRQSLISSDIESRLHSYIVGVARKRQVAIVKINGTDDHLHTLLKLHPAVALSTIIKEIKSYSTGWIKGEGYKQFSWQEGYGAFSCSESHVEPLVKYIESQKEHHLNFSFDQEVDRLNAIWGTSWLRD